VDGVESFGKAVPKGLVPFSYVATFSRGRPSPYPKRLIRLDCIFEALGFDWTPFTKFFCYLSRFDFLRSPFLRKENIGKVLALGFGLVDESDEFEIAT